ncbi:MAG: hypothetical protein V3T86_08935 [Planctomycetota bacterium]
MRRNQLIGLAALLLLATAFVSADPMVGRPPSGPRSGDLLFFSESLAATIHHNCAGCHSDEETAGRYLLRPLDRLDRPNPEIVLQNFRTSLAFLNPVDPERSELLQKAMGELSHGGGAIFGSPTSKEFQALSDFAQGATSDNHPPDAITDAFLDARTGELATLDGSLSADRDDDRIGFSWTLLRKPDRSVATLTDAHLESASFRADHPGIYEAELRVTDGRLWSAPSTLRVTVRGEATTMVPEKTEPQAPDAMPAVPFHERRLDARRLKLIRRLSFDLLWRGPRLHEMSRWYELSHRELVSAFLESEEMWRTWYERQLYYFLLLDRFRPKEGRLTTIPTRLARGELDAPLALQEIIRSQYFAARNPGNDTFVTVILEQCLGMTVQERKNKRILDAGKKMYDGYRARMFKERGNSQAAFVRIVCNQPGYHEHFLRRTYSGLHGGGEIPAPILQRDLERLAKDPVQFRAILHDWLTAPTYLNAVDDVRNKPEIPYVRSLFIDTLDRMPTYEELRNVRNAFLSISDPTPIRLVMGRVLLQSAGARIPAALDAKRFVTEQFLRLLARMPTSGELQTFSNKLVRDPNVTPTVVVWALLSSAEYQTY